RKKLRTGRALVPIWEGITTWCPLPPPHGLFAIREIAGKLPARSCRSGFTRKIFKTNYLAQAKRILLRWRARRSSEKQTGEVKVRCHTEPVNFPGKKQPKAGCRKSPRAKGRGLLVDRAQSESK